MRVNYIIVDAESILLDAVTEEINKENENNEFTIGYPLVIRGKALESSIDDKLSKKELSQRVLYGYCTSFWGNGSFSARIFAFGVLHDLIKESLEKDEIAYIDLEDEDEKTIGNFDILGNNNDFTILTRWLNNFENLIENSKEYKDLIGDIKKFRQIG